MKNQWLKQMRHRMEEHTEKPPEGLWNDIEKELFSEEENKGLIIPIKSNINQTYLFKKKIYRVASVLLLILSVGGVLWFWNSKQSTSVGNTTHYSKNNEERTINNSKNLTDQKEIDQNNIVQFIDKIDEINLDNVQILNFEKNEMVSNVNSIKNSSTSLWKDNSQIDLIAIKSDMNDVVDLLNQKNEKFVNLNDYFIKDIEGLTIAENKGEFEDEIKLVKDQSDKKWYASMGGFGIGSGNSQQLQGYSTMSKASLPLETMIFATDISSNKAFAEVLHQNQGKEVKTKIQHKLPISVGFQIHYSIKNRWSLSSGLQYTNLKSQLKSGSQEHYIVNEQEVKFLGLPLSLHYHFFKNDKLIAYTSAGGQVDFPLQGKLKTNYVNDRVVSNGPEFKINNLSKQFLGTTGLGVQYKITPNLHVYGEPSLVYYFKNNSEIGSLYKEDPLVFQLRFGLKWNLSQ